MRNMKTKRLIAIVLLLAVVGIVPSSIPAAQADNNQVPDLPSPTCDSLRVEPGNRLAFRVYARGVQVYRWNGGAWDFVGPVAMLFADSGHQGQVGHHYGSPAGPVWESNSGSKVVGTRQAGCMPDLSAIPWLLVRAVATNGPGIFAPVTFIQRVNTTGGLAPTDPGTVVNQEVEVPYTTEYFFYRAED